MTTNQMAITLNKAGIPVTKIYDETCAVDPGVALWRKGSKEYAVQVDSYDAESILFTRYNAKRNDLVVLASAASIEELIPRIRMEMR